ncbi:thioesterase II family protein [Streptomyces bauhiniae]|uniref:Thioesterase n=1 Tax=Streptomyces bauhiniae TaxID=2340725 RepID=A0A7K3QYD7_9ACTN|nr:alpha/beta fold hydrolase [Streptomyces bauhiniae]NEB94899.1 thioesterase [Streptomyces bauhiniae]
MTTPSRPRRNPWLNGRPRTTAPERHLYCFPHSGGLPGEYVRWEQHLSGTQVYGVCLPGRGSRTAEPALTDMDAVVHALLAETRFAAPYDLFGHSLGALVAYETTRELAARGLPLPERLIVSAFPAPHLPRQGARLSGLPDEELIAVLNERYGGIPPQIAADPDLLAVLLPAFRADFALLENYRYREAGPLPVPLVVLGGEADSITPDQLDAWHRHSTAPVRRHAFAGGHFYFRDDLAAVAAVLAP